MNGMAYLSLSLIKYLLENDYSLQHPTEVKYNELTNFQLQQSNVCVRLLKINFESRC